MQCVCFLELLSLKKFFKTSSSSRCGLVSSRIFYPLPSLFLPLCSFKTNNPSIHPADTSIDLHLHRRRKLISIDLHLHPADTSIDLHLHLRRSLLFAATPHHTSSSLFTFLF
ncbi:hypothetical protein Hanom_Chr00s000001g01592231 [Helianthus anomalus]